MTKRPSGIVRIGMLPKRRCSPFRSSCLANKMQLANEQASLPGALVPLPRMRQAAMRERRFCALLARAAKGGTARALPLLLPMVCSSAAVGR